MKILETPPIFSYWWSQKDNNFAAETIVVVPLRLPEHGLLSRRRRFVAMRCFDL